LKNLDFNLFVKITRVLFDCLIRKNDFVEVSKNLVRYRSENNFVELLK